MLTILFWVLMVMIFGKILLFAIKAAWGISKIIISLVFLPLTLIFLMFQGLLILALPILLVVGVVSLFIFHD